jgi:ribonucleoside-diphosphate reductase alpha chain
MPKLQHERDMKFSYAAVKQLEGKYLVQNRTNGDIYESPQQLYMLYIYSELEQHTGTRIPDLPFSSFGPSHDYDMDLCLEVYL